MKLGVYLKCSECGATFEKRRDRVFAANFCGRPCLWLFRRKERDSVSLQERLEALCIPEPNSGCTLFFGSWNPDGYGHMRRGRGSNSEGAHRIAWLVYRGPIPPRQQVLHRCDVRCCVNPDHLFLGSQKQNIADMVAKGRHSRGPLHAVGYLGERHPNRKLTEAAVRAIRADPRSQSKIAAAFNISRGVVGMVKMRKAWAHVSNIDPDIEHAAAASTDPKWAEKLRSGEL